MSESAQPNIGIVAGFDVNASGWAAAMNKNLRLLDALTFPRALTAGGDIPIADNVAVNGDMHIVGSSPTGLWAGNANRLAIRMTGADISSHWAFVTPKKSWRVFNVAADAFFEFDGTAWAEVANTGGGGEDPDPEEPVEEPDASGLGWLNYLFLMHMENVSPSNFVDSGPGAKYFGQEELTTSTAQFKFGARSLRLEAGERFFFGNETDLHINTNTKPGSIDFWIRVDDVSTQRWLFRKNLAIVDDAFVEAANGFTFKINAGGSLTYSHPGTAESFTTDEAISAATWTFVRLVKDGTFIRIQIGTVSKSGTIEEGLANSLPMLMGDGGMYLDEVRWVKGKILSTSVPEVIWSHTGGLG